MRMHNPPHPGEVLRELCLEPLGLSVTAAAEALGVARKTLSAILNGRSGISPEMAILSLADASEAASRSIEKPTPQKITNMMIRFIFPNYMNIILS